MDFRTLTLHITETLLYTYIRRHTWCMTSYTVGLCFLNMLMTIRKSSKWLLYPSVPGILLLIFYICVTCKGARTCSNDPYPCHPRKKEYIQVHTVIIAVPPCVPVVVLAMAGIYIKQYVGSTLETGYFIVVLLGVAVFCLVARLGLVVVRACKSPLYVNNKIGDDPVLSYAAWYWGYVDTSATQVVATYSSL